MRGLNYPSLTNQRAQRLMGTSLRVILKLYRGLMAPHAGQLVTKYWLWDQSITERSGAKIMNSLCVTGDKSQSLGNSVRSGVKSESPWHVVSSWYLHFQGRWCNWERILSAPILRPESCNLTIARTADVIIERDRAYRSSWQGSCELIEHCWMSVTDSLMRLILDITQRVLVALWTLKRSLGGYFVCCFTGI